MSNPYGKGALRSELKRLEGILDGEGEVTRKEVFNSAWRLANKVPTGDLTPDDVRSFLLHHATKWFEDTRPVAKDIERALTKGAARPPVADGHTFVSSRAASAEIIERFARAEANLDYRAAFGRTASTDKLVLTAFVAKARELNMVEGLKFSVRSVGEAAAVRRDTAAASINRLVNKGIISVVNGSTDRTARAFRLQVQEVERLSEEHPLLPGQREAKSVTGLLLSGVLRTCHGFCLDPTDFLGKPTQGFIFHELMHASEAMTSTEIATALGRPARTIRYNLKQMLDAGLVVLGDDGYELGSVEPFDYGLASVHPTSGKNARERARDRRQLHDNERRAADDRQRRRLANDNHDFALVDDEEDGAIVVDIVTGERIDLHAPPQPERRSA